MTSVPVCEFCHKNKTSFINFKKGYKKYCSSSCFNISTKKGKISPHRSNTEDFTKKATKKHNGFYSYEKSIYSKAKNKLIITCPKHGDFLQSPDVHVRMGCGCKKCCDEKLHNLKVDKNWKEKFIKIHGNKFDYSESIYINDSTKLEIKCNICGNKFYQYSNNHKKFGCPFCAKNAKHTLESFLKKSNEFFANLYDYSLITKDNFSNKNKLPIICEKHGIFYKKMSAHISEHKGCPKCHTSKGEHYITSYLTKINEQFITDKTFPTCINIVKLRFDFYFPERNLILEFDGIQHFQPVERFGGKEAFEYLKKCDKIKNEWCKLNNIKLIRISYKDLRSGKIKEILDSIFQKETIS